jgi:hypothetical protein
MRRSIIFHDNWRFHVPKWPLPKLLKWPCQDLVLINGGVDILSIFQFKKHTWPHLTPPKCPPEHHPSTSCTFSVIDTIRVKLFIILSPYPVSGVALNSYFHTHLICPNIGLSILHSQMSMASSELETTLPVKFLEKGSASGYLMIIAKVFKSDFELSDANVKLKVLDD